EPRVGTWSPPQMEIVREDEGVALEEADAPWLGEHALIFRSAAARALEPFLASFGEMLPLRCADAEVVMFNPFLLHEALDEEASTIARYRSGRIMTIERYVFRPDVTAGVHIFKISNLRGSPSFVSESWVKCWKSSRLRGLEFKEVWRATLGN